MMTRIGAWATRLLDHLESLDCLPRLAEAGPNFGHAGWCKDSEEDVVCREPVTTYNDLSDEMGDEDVQIVNT